MSTSWTSQAPHLNSILLDSTWVVSAPPPVKAASRGGYSRTDEQQVGKRTQRTENAPTTVAQFPSPMEQKLVRRVVENLAAKRSDHGTEVESEAEEDEDADADGEELDDESTDEESGECQTKLFTKSTCASADHEQPVGGKHATSKSSFVSVPLLALAENTTPSWRGTEGVAILTTNGNNGDNRNEEPPAVDSHSWYNAKQRERRLERNRNTARERRKRKLLLTVQLQNTVYLLTTQNNELRRKNKRLKEDLVRFDEYMQSKRGLDTMDGPFKIEEDATVSCSDALVASNEIRSATEAEGQLERMEALGEGKNNRPRNEANEKQVQTPKSSQVSLKNEEETVNRVSLKEAIQKSSGSNWSGNTYQRRVPEAGRQGISPFFLGGATSNDVLLLRTLQQQQPIKRSHKNVSAALKHCDQQHAIFPTELPSEATISMSHLSGPPLSACVGTATMLGQTLQNRPLIANPELLQQPNLLAVSLEESKEQPHDLSSLLHASLGTSHLLSPNYHNQLLWRGRGTPRLPVPSSLTFGGFASSMHQLPHIFPPRRSFPSVVTTDSLSSPKLVTGIGGAGMAGRADETVTPQASSQKTSYSTK